MKVAVYTCITGDYDSPLSPRRIDPRIDYHYFGDSLAGVPAPWRRHTLDLKQFDAKDQNRFVKMHPHELDALRDYDLTIYVDGNIEIVGDLYELATSCWDGPHDIYFYEHPFRRCLYEETRECVRIGHARLDMAMRQMRRYRASGFPLNAGLFEAGVMIRKSTEPVKRLMSAWWREYRGGIRRDQVSLTYVAWRTGITLGSLGSSDHRFGHRYFQLLPHGTRRRPLTASLHGRANRAVLRLAPWLLPR